MVTPSISTFCASIGLDELRAQIMAFAEDAIFHRASVDSPIACSAARSFA